MDCRNLSNLISSHANDKRTRRRKKSFTEALKEKYCVEDEPTFDFIIVSPKKRNNNNAAELGHLHTVVLNEMNVTRADIPCHGLMSLCPNVVDLDLANNLLDKWTELLAILSHLPKVKYVNVSRNNLRLNLNDPLPSTMLSVENLALNDTGMSLEEISKLSAIMPKLKELHLCGNSYDSLADIDQRISDGAFASLECLRLNNNHITSWNEVWKLRYLPHLKFLVLSGNPIRDIFYNQDSDQQGLLLPSSYLASESQGLEFTTLTSVRAPDVSMTHSESGVEDADVFDEQIDGNMCSKLKEFETPSGSDESEDSSDKEKTDSDTEDHLFDRFLNYLNHTENQDTKASLTGKDLVVDSECSLQDKKHDSFQDNSYEMRSLCNTLLSHSMYQMKILNADDIESDPFTPRSVLFEEDFLAPMRQLDNCQQQISSKSLQGCLFKFDTISQKVDSCGHNSCNDLLKRLQTDSDSCCDIEVEQQRCKPWVDHKHNYLAACLHHTSAFDHIGSQAVNCVPTKSVNFNTCEISVDDANNSCKPNIPLAMSHQPTVSTPVNQNFTCPAVVSKDLTSTSPALSDFERPPKPKLRPFEQLQILCLSNASLSHHTHLIPFMSFPSLTNIRLKNNPLYSCVNPEDRRKLYIASLPSVNILNGSEISSMEREKAERHYLRYYMDSEDKPEIYHTLVKKHGPPVKLVDIDLSAGYQEWATLKFVCENEVKFTRRIHLVEPVDRLRKLIAIQMAVPKSCFVMYHHACGPSHPESKRELTELRCESMPMSRFDFAEGDEIHIDIRD